MRELQDLYSFPTEPTPTTTQSLRGRVPPKHPIAHFNGRVFGYSPSLTMPAAFMGRRSARWTTAVAAVPIPFLVRKRTRPLRRRDALAVIIPGDSVLESTTIGGTAAFFNIYQNVIVARILLSWFPGVQSNPVVRPLITVCDPYLNLFRSTVPPIFGLDLSPVLALLLLQALGTATTALGAELNEKHPVASAKRNRFTLPWWPQRKQI